MAAIQRRTRNRCFSGRGLAHIYLRHLVPVYLLKMTERELLQYLVYYIRLRDRAKKKRIREKAIKKIKYAAIVIIAYSQGINGGIRCQKMERK